MKIKRIKGLSLKKLKNYSKRSLKRIEHLNNKSWRERHGFTKYLNKVKTKEN